MAGRSTSPDAAPNRGGTALARLTALARDLAGARDVDATVRLTIHALHDALRPDRSLVVLRTRDGAGTVAYAEGHAGPAREDPLTRHAATHGPMLVARVTDEFLADLGGPVDTAVGSWIGTPLRAGDEPLGAVSLVTAAPDRFGPADLQFLEAATALLGMALEHHAVLQQLSHGKREWEQMVDAIGQAFCVVDPEGIIRRANRAFSVIAHAPVTTLAGRPWLSVLPEGWTAGVARALATVEHPSQYEVRSGDRIFTVTALPLAESTGGAVLVFDEQTEKRRLQEQLIQSEKLSAIGQLIAGVAHDLNNPLASVVGFADYLVEEAEPPPALRQPLEAIRDEAERAAGIVRHLLDFARKQEAQRLPHPIGPVLEATLALVRNQLMASKVEAVLAIDPTLPDVAIDRHQIQQVFVNLLNNATQAIRSSGAGGTIRVSATRWLDGVAVTIDDDGPGVPPQVASRIFEPFFTTKPEGEGTGLGLSICQGILTEHGGRIGYAPRPGGGSTFRVELPGGHAPTPPAAPPRPQQVGALRILVVEDEPHIQHYLRATLEAWGHTVVLASDGASALACVQEGRFDAVLTDLRMPNLGGREFYETLCASDPGQAARVVFATGDTVGDDALGFLESSGRPFLRKPFTLTELRAAIAEAASA